MSRATQWAPLAVPESPQVGLFDAFNDTLIGALSDKTHTRFGALSARRTETVGRAKMSFTALFTLSHSQDSQAKTTVDCCSTISGKNVGGSWSASSHHCCLSLHCLLLQHTDHQVIRSDIMYLYVNANVNSLSWRNLPWRGTPGVDGSSFGKEVATS